MLRCINVQTIKAYGVVKEIAANHESIRIFHDPIAELNWPAMNMPFEIGEMFTLVKVRRDQPKGDYTDPGWYNHPQGTIARKI